MVESSPVPVVVDADGLYALGRLDGPLVRPGDDAALGARGDAPPAAGNGPSSPTMVLTPHDGEYRRLAGEPPGPDRAAAARRLALAAGGVALVKGSTTAVADPVGRVRFGVSGGPRLATAGTGDVLSGMIGAFIARGVAPLEAAALAAHVHGRAAARGPEEGLVAGDLPELVSSVLSDARRALRSEPGGPGPPSDPSGTERPMPTERPERPDPGGGRR